MPSKFQTTVAMAEYTAKDISSRPEVFAEFLTTAAHNYKYGFRDQMLIFAQKPNATACAEIEVWNKLGRYVNRGTKGIALLVDRNVPYRLRHVFDIADTNSFHGNEVKLWQMKPEYEEAVTEALENSFGEVDNKTGFADVLLGISELIVSDNFSDYCEKLKSVKHGSFLEEVDDLNTEVYFRGLLKNSVAYMLLTRCGYDAAEYLDAEDFRDICNFNTVDTLNIIGCANRDISEMVLREVAETVRAVERESKAPNRTFEKPKEIKDNITENKTLEGSIENGTDLQERGRLPSPEHSGAGSSEDREIWDAAAHISAALPQDDVVGIAAERKTERAPRTDRPSGERDDGNSDEQDGEIAGSERRTQGEQPNEVGSDDEQHQSVGGGNGAEGHRLQLSGHNYNGPSEVPYYHNEDEKAELLHNCIALKDHRKEIATFIAEHEDRKECGNFIKGFFDNTYVEHILDNGQRVGYRAYDDLLTIWKGSYLSRESDAFISWERVANKIYGLILTHEWLSPDEQPLPTVGEQFRLFEEANAEKANQFTLPQEAIDYVLRGAGNISQGRLSTYDQFLKQEGKEKNIAFLKNGYGIGGGSDAIPESGYWESHDGKGIKIYKGIGDEQKSVLLPWNKVEKRIGELIEADRYLTAADKEAYPKYKREKMLRNERYELMREFRSIYEDYNDFERQLGNESAVLSMFELGDCASQFMNGEKRCQFVSGNPFVLPTMRDALHKIIDAKTHLTERAEKMLEALSGDLAKPLEPSYDELNPPPEPEKEYRFSLGDTVHIGADEYSILSIDDKSVLLNDSNFPLLCEEMKREEFDRKIAENPMNDKYLQAVETVPEKADGPLDNEKIRITLDSGRDAVHWIYYNPDSDAGGLYVSGDLAFSAFEELVEEYDIANHPENAEKFFSDLEEMSDQFLAEINTPFFLEAEDDYESDYDYIEFTPGNILSIHNDILELNAEHQAELSKTAAQESQTPVSASEREAEVLESVLNKLNIGDIKLAFEDGELVAADDSNNVWRGKQFYDFLVEDAISYDEYGKPNEIDGDVLANFTELCGLHGVEVKDYNASSPWDEYEKAKKENPDAVVMQKVGDFFEMFGEEDTKIAHEVLDLTLTQKTFTNKSITTPMCGFPLFKTEEYTQKILDAGYDVVFVTHEPGEKLEIRRIVSSAKEKAEISLAPPPEQKKQSKITPSILYPEIKSDYRTNFRMCSLTGKSEEEIAEDLKGVIFLNPRYSERSRELKYLPADEYLSGNIREKLNEAKTAAEDDGIFEINVKALIEVMPKDLSAGEISVRLGATWIPPEDIERFMFELFGTARYISFNIHVHYSEYTGEWNIEGKSYDRNNVKVYNAYGTNRINGYKIIEETLNLRDVRVFDYIEDENGNKKPVLNKNDTAVAQGKQQLIKDAFADWIWKDQERRDRLCKLYNEKFNSVRPREYNGEHLNFVGINPEITLRPHQVNAIAHILYGGNTLLAHVVGAGKTFEMVAAAQESKRLGLCNKSLFAVPNHLTEQWAAEYLQLYPSANILVASKKDFETKNRKKFCGRIATGDYDAVIIGHSQFEKIPMSVERQQAILNQQLEEIMNGISELKRNRGENFSIKQLEKAKKTVKQKLEKLNDQTRKDDIVTFEELGVDRLFVDEAHYYKNLAAFTKMRNVGGISQTEAQKSSDLYMKCRYLDELTGGKGVVFATGTPISNSMVELYLK